MDACRRICSGWTLSSNIFTRHKGQRAPVGTLGKPGFSREMQGKKWEYGISLLIVFEANFMWISFLFDVAGSAKA